MNDIKECQICGAPATSPHPTTTCGKEYALCGWCQMRVMQYVDGNIGNSVINIYWGAGHIGWSCWEMIRDFIREHDIKEVLEYGTGVSTELFVNEGLKVISMDIWEQHSKLYAKHQYIKNKADIIWYPKSTELPNLEELYPGKKWDFVFVDGPQERSNEVKQAMSVCSKYLMLHDPNLGEQTFFPDENWKPLKHKIWERVS